MISSISSPHYIIYSPHYIIFLRKTNFFQSSSENKFLNHLPQQQKNNVHKYDRQYCETAKGNSNKSTDKERRNVSTVHREKEKERERKFVRLVLTKAMHG